MQRHTTTGAGTWVSVARCLLVGLVFIPSAAEATIESVTVITSRHNENADGYTYAEITVRGSVVREDGSVGHYSVPAVIIYPGHGRGNGVGVVDWLNSAYYHFFPPDTELGTFQFTLLATGNYLFEEGYTYLSIQWNKAVTEIFGAAAPDDGQPHNHLIYGFIERSADAWEILLDAARLLKEPHAYPSPDGPARVGTVLSSGYSQGAAAGSVNSDRHFSGNSGRSELTPSGHTLAASSSEGRDDRHAHAARNPSPPSRGTRPGGRRASARGGRSHGSARRR